MKNLTFWRKTKTENQILRYFIRQLVKYSQAYENDLGRGLSLTYGITDFICGELQDNEIINLIVKKISVEVSDNLPDRKKAKAKLWRFFEKNERAITDSANRILNKMNGKTAYGNIGENPIWCL